MTPCVSLGLMMIVLATGLPAGWDAGPGIAAKEDKLEFTQRQGSLRISLPEGVDTILGLRLASQSGQSAIGLWREDTEIARIGLRRDRDGDVLNLQPMGREEVTGKWAILRGQIRALMYRPPTSHRLIWSNLREAGIPGPEGWPERLLQLRVLRTAETLTLSLDGTILWTENLPAGDVPVLQLELLPGDTVEPVSQRELEVPGGFHPIEIRHFTGSGEKPDELVVQDGIPFLKPADAGVDLRKAGWPLVRDLPSSYNAPYDFGPAFLHDTRTPVVEGPSQDLRAVHFLVRGLPVEGGPAAERFSIRLGSFGGRDKVFHHDYHLPVPRAKELQVLTLPVTELLAQDLEKMRDRPTLQAGLSKELHLLRRSPDPSRFQIRPLGLVPGVEILGITYEPAPLQLRLRSEEPGHVFPGVKEARFTAEIFNRSTGAQNYRLRWIATDRNGESIEGKASGRLHAGGSESVPVSISPDRWGYFDFDVFIQAGDNPEQRRHSSFALLPPDERAHRAESPFGTWTFGGTHASCDDPEILGPLLHRAGLRFGMGSFPGEREKWGILTNFEPKGIDDTKKYLKWVERQKKSHLPVALLMHEHSISGDHVTRVPDHFTGRKPYRLSPKEKERFDQLWDEQIAMAKIMREHFPDIHLRLGNGPLPTKEEFYRRGFPAELFDSAGNEAGSYGRLPEAQPPDWVANNASLWMDRQLLDAYGYTDKPVTQCYEITYPSTNPGNLDPMDQAAYFIRHGLHSLAWRIPEIRFGLLDDVGSSYRFSNWGASGLVNAWPHMNPKPAYVAVATMTRELDGAEFLHPLDTGSNTVYAMEFERKDRRRVLPVWTVRGACPVAIEVTGDGWTLADWEGNHHHAEAIDGVIHLESGTMPLFLSGRGKIGSIRTGSPVHETQPAAGAVHVAALDTLDGWTPQHGPDPVLDYHNPLTPRRNGEFEFAVATATGDETPALRIDGNAQDGPPAVPVYGILKADNPLPLPGEPSEIGLWIEGNSGWGRVIFELEDASGQTWTAIGASSKSEPSEWMLDWLPEELARSGDGTARRADWNTNDVLGLGAICFDGWRYVRFPLPGNYPGEHAPWPANSQWRSDKDGVVHYPLKLTKLVFEMPTHVLKLTDHLPLRERSIRVRDLFVEFGTQGSAKQGVYENEPRSHRPRPAPGQPPGGRGSVRAPSHHPGPLPGNPSGVAFAGCAI